MKIKRPFIQLLILFGASMLALNACTPAGNESPETVIQKFKASIKEVETIDFVVTLEMNGVEAEDNIDFNLEADVKLDRQEEAEQKMDLDLKVDGNLKTGENQWDGNIHAKIKTLGDDYYFNVLSLESTDPNMETIQMMLQPFQNTWQHMTSDFIPPEIRQLQTKDEAALQKEEELKDLFISTNLFEVTKEYGVEKLDGRSVYHYGVRLNKDGLREYIRKGAVISGEALTNAEVEESVQFADTARGMEMWIGVKDHYLYKGVVNLTGDNSEEGISSKISLLYTANSYNKKLKIEPPETYQEFNPLALLMRMQIPEEAPVIEEGEVMEEATE